jgi:hypothetical protein
MGGLIVVDESGLIGGIAASMQPPLARPIGIDPVDAVKGRSHGLYGGNPVGGSKAPQRPYIQERGDSLLR